jgi:predicted membrane-bound spermidine synthase
VAAIYVMFLASGVASLIYQVVWFKQLQFVLGSSTFAVSMTVAGFFFGLSLGSWLGGKLADRARHPLSAYAFLELALGILAILVTLFLSNWLAWAPGMGPIVGNPFFFSFATLVLPTMLMGATLPVLAKHVIREHSVLAQRIGVLYGVNTLGAAIGCAVVGFVLIGTLGVTQSAFVGSLIYLANAALAGALARGAAAHESSTAASPAAAPHTSHDPAVPSWRTNVLVAVFAVSGFASIAYEVLWFRVLANFQVHTVFAFSAMLATYLVGLVLGAFICARFLAPRKDRLLLYFARLQLLIAAGGLLTVGLLGRSRNMSVAFNAWLHPINSHGAFDWLAGTTETLLLCVVVLLIPTTLIGISLPLASELTIQHVSVLGRRLGRLYAMNTMGGTLGSLTAGFVLVPYLGTQTSLTLIVALNLALFLVVVASQPSLSGDGRLRRLSVWGIVFVCAGSWILGPNYLAQAQTTFEEAEVLAFRETRDATFVVLGYKGEGTDAYQQLLVNGWSYANNAMPGRRYMATLAHLPTLLHRNPRSALLGCIGTGTTIGDLTLHPELRKIVAVDLSKAVFDFAPLFVPLNHSFHREPRVDKVVADVRHYLLRSSQTFDVITFEPPPPHDAGVVNLYSQEFYALAKRRLAPGGVVAQWMPLDFSRQAVPRMMIRTMMAEFPYVSLWIPNRMEGVAIGSMEPLKVDLGEWRRRMQSPGLRDDMAAIGFQTPEDLAATFVAAGPALQRFIGDGPLVTDDRPRIEYFNFYPIDFMDYDDITKHREPIDSYLSAPPADAAVLRASEHVAQAIWREHEAGVGNRYDEARAFLETALKQDPDNVYLRYLRTTHEQRDTPARSSSGRRP